MAERQQLGLYVTHGLQQGQFFPLDESVDAYLIGRGPQATIHLTDQGVSKRHASISFRNDYWFVNDTNSANGTYLNNYRVVENVLRVHDRIIIGIAELQVAPCATIKPKSQLPPPKKSPSLTSTVSLPANFRIEADSKEFSTLEDMEKEHVRQAMAVADGYKEMAANLLGVTVEELQQKLKIIAASDPVK